MPARLLLACLAVGCAKVSPEDVKIQEAAKAQAERVQSAVVRGEFDTVVDLTHPKVVRQLGGRERMIEVMARGLEEMRADGVAFEGVRMLDPSHPVRAGSDVYVVVPFELTMTAPGRRLAARAAVLGVSGDGGKTWSFIDTTPGRAALKQLFPDLPDSLEIPQKEPPTVLDD